MNIKKRVSCMADYDSSQEDVRDSKEYSCTPMEPIRIQRRLVQSSSLLLSPLLSSLDGFTMLEERQEMVGWSSNIPSAETLPPPLW